MCERGNMDVKELAEKYSIDLNKLEKEQEHLAKNLEIKNKIDFSLADRFGGIKNSMVGKKMVSSIIVCNKDFEILDQAYFLDRIRFPYIPGFVAYRDLPLMVEAFNKLEEKPDVVFVSGQGITHQRLGIASHFSLSVGIPCIGVANSLVDSDIKFKAKDGEEIKRNEKVIGKVLMSKPGSKPMYVSPGNLISVDTSYKLAKEFIQLPHKLPEPLTLANKYAKEIRKELLE